MSLHATNERSFPRRSMDRIRDMVTLKYENTSDFTESYLIGNNARIRNYRFYILLTALAIFSIYFIGGWAYLGADLMVKAALIHLTSWTFFFLMVDLFLSFMVVVKHLSWGDKKMRILIKIHWIVYYISANCSIIVTVGYWALVHPFLDFDTQVLAILLFPVHGLNAVYHVANIYLTKTPFQIGHIYFGILFCSIYVIFSGVYFAAGGTGLIGPEGLGLEGFEYIYYVLDYAREHKRATSVCVAIFLGVIGPVISHLILWRLAKHRDSKFKDMKPKW